MFKAFSFTIIFIQGAFTTDVAGINQSASFFGGTISGTSHLSIFSHKPAKEFVSLLELGLTVETKAKPNSRRDTEDR